MKACCDVKSYETALWACEQSRSLGLNLSRKTLSLLLWHLLEANRPLEEVLRVYSVIRNSNSALTPKPPNSSSNPPYNTVTSTPQQVIASNSCKPASKSTAKNSDRNHERRHRTQKKQSRPLPPSAVGTKSNHSYRKAPLTA